MEIYIAKNSGFCFGVKRAVNIAKKLLAKNKNIYTIGEIIHNPTVIDELKKKGLKNITNLNIIKKGIFLIRSHGIEKKIKNELINKGIKFYDATCPFVKRIENIIKKHKNNSIILFGDNNHPEVLALKSYVNNNIYIIEKFNDIFKLGELKNPILISQTTKSITEFNKIKLVLEKKYKNIKVFKTICNETESRQNEAKEIAQKYDCIFVIGGKNSANTRRLYEISKKYQKNTFLIEDIKKNLPIKKFDKIKKTAILSGASTPDIQVKNLKNKLQMRYKNYG